MATPSGIPVLGDLAPGTHVGQLYRDRHDLLETLIPFFATGLAQHERCLWVTSFPLCAADARAALARVVPDLTERERSGQIEILDHSEWYTRTGPVGPDTIIAAWLDAEQAALRDGYRALRVSGNTFWLEPSQWQAFSEYEARVHEAFKDRNIVALCSYALSKCDSHEVVDVLRNHTVSLVRATEGWQLVHGATAALASLEPEHAHAPRSRPHTVEFYRTRYPAGRVVDRLVDTLGKGHAACAIVTADHAVAIRAELATRALDIATLVGRGQLLILDADAIFAETARASGREELLRQLVLRPVLDAMTLFGHVYVYGELVDLFARSGDRDTALALERWWNELLVRHPIELACSYSLDSFADGDTVGAFRQVCDEHAAVGLDAHAVDSDVDRLRVELAQVTSALANEMARRQVAEEAYEAARGTREQLVRLERLAAALGEVTNRPQLVEVITEVVTPTLAVDGIVVLEDCAGEMRALVSHGLGVDRLRQIGLTATRAQWSSEALGIPASSPLHAYVAVPLQAAGGRLGVCVLGYAASREFTAGYRALVQDVARQLALALDRAATYERLEHECERAELASRAKDEFLAMLGHELRNPLSPIVTATQLMRLRGHEGLERERTVIERQVKHMIRLVDDLLDVSRITRGKVELRRRSIEIADIVAQAVELASPALEERAHRLTLQVPPSGVVVHADAERIAQVLSNLLTNAAKYTPQGGAIHLEVHPGASTVSISVRDNGIGIDPKLLPHIFDLFVQGRQGIDRASGGLGLGLAIARSLLEMHGGSIRARSDGPGKGSEITVELPRFANTRPSRNNVSGGFPLPVSHSRRVLVVDDNEDAAFLFSEALKRLGHQVDVAYDGPSALVCARERPPEIAFLDIGLPVMDGYELGRRLRELCGTPPRLIAVTGYGHTSDRARSRDAGFELHLVKPIELSVVQEALAKLD